MKELLEALIEENANVSDEKIPMKGNTITYMNPGFAEVLNDLNKEAKEMSKENEKLEKENEKPKTEVYKAIPKDKMVFASFVCEYTFNENNHNSNVDFLGIYSDPKKAEKICDECIMKWRPITVIEPEPDNKILYKVKGEYFFDNELMRLTVRNMIILMVELDKFDIIMDKENLSSCKINRDVYIKILKMFNTFKDDKRKIISKLERGIHYMLEAEK